MTDLRTRITAVIASCRIPPDDMTSDELAEAVIRELNLREDRVGLLVRYVTGWETDEQTGLG